VSIPISGQITVTAGSPATGPDVNGNVFVYQAHPGNSGNVYVGNAHGTVDENTGLVLAAGDAITLAFRPGQLRFDGAQSNDVVCWHIYS